MRKWFMLCNAVRSFGKECHGFVAVSLTMTWAHFSSNTTVFFFYVLFVLYGHCYCRNDIERWR